MTLAHRGWVLFCVVCTLLVFLLAIRLLGAATTHAAPQLQGYLTHAMPSDLSSLGGAWFATYLLLSGSAIAAFSVALFNAGTVSVGQLFTMVGGSRLGAAAFVILLGCLYRLRRGEGSWRKAMGPGMLALLVTQALYIPVLTLGYLYLPTILELAAGAVRPGARLPEPRIVSGLTEGVVERVGPVPAVTLGIFVMIGAFSVLDRAIAHIDQDRLRRTVTPLLHSRWPAFSLGLLLTAVAASVAFSVGILVPLASRRLIQPREVVPYLLGANVGTLSDTLVVALVLGSPGAVVVVTWLALCALAVAVLAMALGRPFSRGIHRVYLRAVHSRARFLGVSGLLVATPVLLVALG